MVRLRVASRGGGWTIAVGCSQVRVRLLRLPSLRRATLPHVSAYIRGLSGSPSLVRPPEPRCSYALALGPPVGTRTAATDQTRATPIDIRASGNHQVMACLGSCRCCMRRPSGANQRQGSSQSTAPRCRRRRWKPTNADTTSSRAGPTPRAPPTEVVGGACVDADGTPDGVRTQTTSRATKPNRRGPQT